MKNPDWLSFLGYSLTAWPAFERKEEGSYDARKGAREEGGGRREEGGGRREERPPRSRASKFPLPLPFLTPATQATLGIENP